MMPLIVIFLQLMWSTAAAQQESSFFLPKPDECGQLKEQYLYNSERITAVDEFPWMARVKFTTLRHVGAPEIFSIEEHNDYNCLAVLISRRHLLANARFFQDGVDYEDIAIELGTWNSAPTLRGAVPADCDAFGQCATPPSEHEIEEIAVHPNFSRDATAAWLFHNDIAVVRLRREVTFGAYAQPICLPESPVLNNNVARYLPYTGFARSLADGTKKLKILTRGVSSQICGRLGGLQITDGLLCAVGAANSVRLHFGSALMDVAVENAEPQRYYLIGLLSAVAQGPSKFAPDILVRVAAYVEWIKYNMY